MSTPSWWESKTGQSLSRQPKRVASGMTIVELLISCGLFMLVTMTFFQIMTPALQRSWKVERKQDKMQNFILFKELMTRRMDNCMLIQGKVYTQSIEFYSPYQVDALGSRVNMIDTAEMIYWNEKIFYRIYVKTEGDEKIVTENLEGGERKIWNLGKGGTLAFSLSPGTNPLLMTEVTIYDSDNSSSLPFRKSFSTFIRNFK